MLLRCFVVLHVGLSHGVVCVPQFEGGGVSQLTMRAATSRCTDWFACQPEQGLNNYYKLKGLHTRSLDMSCDNLVNKNTC